MKDLWHWDQAEIHTVPLTLEALSSGSAPELLDCFHDFSFFCFLGFLHKQTHGLWSFFGALRTHF